MVFVRSTDFKAVLSEIVNLSKILCRITHRLITRDPPILGNEEDLPLEKSERVGNSEKNDVLEGKTW